MPRLKMAKRLGVWWDWIPEPCKCGSNRRPDVEPKGGLACWFCMGYDGDFVGPVERG